MSDVAFLGMGAMGAPMARRLLAAGHHVTVWNRTPARAEALRADGADVAATPAEAVAGAAYVLTMLSDAAAVESVAAAFAPALAAGAVVVEMSTIGPDAEHRVRALLPDSVAVADAPVMGSVDRAAAGALTVLAGGAVDAARPVLAELGDIVDCGGFGAGAARKIVLINAVIAGVAVVGEALALADRLGVPDAGECWRPAPWARWSAAPSPPAPTSRWRWRPRTWPSPPGLADLPVLAAARDRLLAVPIRTRTWGRWWRASARGRRRADRRRGRGRVRRAGSAAIPARVRPCPIRPTLRGCPGMGGFMRPVPLLPAPRTSVPADLPPGSFGMPSGMPSGGLSDGSSGTGPRVAA